MNPFRKFGEKMKKIKEAIKSGKVGQFLNKMVTGVSNVYGKLAPVLSKVMPAAAPFITATSNTLSRVSDKWNTCFPNCTKNLVDRLAGNRAT